MLTRMVRRAESARAIRLAHQTVVSSNKEVPMDLDAIINILRPIPSEFHHNDYVDRAIAVAIKRIGELEHANVPTVTDIGLLGDSESPRQQAPEQASTGGLADSADPARA
jgi:hypothetical protein